MSVTVTVDDREPTGVVETVREHADVDAVDVRRLDTGDIVFGDVGVERKTPSDYVDSVFRPSGSDLHDQVTRLTEQYDHAYVLVEGDLADVDDLRGAPSPAAVRGSMASITARHDAPVVPCSDRDRLVDVAIRLGRKHVEPPSTRPLPTGGVTGRTEPVAKKMYGCIDGVGPAVADRLHRTFPTVASLTAASQEELTTVDGIGEKRAAVIYESLHERSER